MIGLFIGRASGLSANGFSVSGAALVALVVLAWRSSGGTAKIDNDGARRRVKRESMII